MSKVDRRPARAAAGLAAGVALLLLAGCRQDMHDQPRYKPFAQSSFFGDGRSARPLVEGTIARHEVERRAQRRGAGAERT